MTHSIDYQVGMELFVPPLMGGGEGSTAVISKVDADFAYIASGNEFFEDFQIDKAANRITRGYKQEIYASKEQYEQITLAHKIFLANIKILDEVTWSEINSQHLSDVIAIACPDANIAKPKPFLWHELSHKQLAQIVAILRPQEVA